MDITIKQLTGEYLQFHCENKNGFSVDILNLGGIIQRIFLPNGRDVVLGYDTVEEYLENSYYFGAAIGPFANRIANGEFFLNEEKYVLEKNNGENSLHSGAVGLHQKVFLHKIENDTLILRTSCPHLEGGFPGNRDIEIHYKVGEDDSLSIEYFGKSDISTVFNMTNHSYFNLNGCDDCLSHDLQMESDFFTLNDENNVPTGEILSVENTPLDFRKGKKMGDDIDSNIPLMSNPKGYDHNFVLNQNKELKKVAEVCSNDVSLSVSTDCPCVQFYTGNFIEHHQGKNGKVYGNRSGFCLETGVYPNNMNVPTFSTEVVKEEDIWNYKTIFQFGEVVEG